jgi:hypothetical protein
MHVALECDQMCGKANEGENLGHAFFSECFRRQRKEYAAAGLRSRAAARKKQARTHSAFSTDTFPNCLAPAVEETSDLAVRDGERAAPKRAA